MDQLRLRTVEISKLKDHPRNYRDHPQAQLDHLIRSIEENGYYRNVVVAKDYTVLAGHGVVAALRKMDAQTIQVKRMSWRPDDPRALKLLASDNEVERLADVDDRALLELLRELHASEDLDLLGTGYDEATFEGLEELAGGTIVEDPESEWSDLPDMSQEDLPVHREITVKFHDDEGIRSFEEAIGRELPDTKYFWYPEERNAPGTEVFWSSPDNDQDPPELEP